MSLTNIMNRMLEHGSPCLTPEYGLMYSDILLFRLTDDFTDEYMALVAETT